MKVLQTGFKDEQQEINFFKNIKPQILGKLIYYNKVFRIETTCPVSTGRIHQSYFENQLKSSNPNIRKVYAMKIFTGTTVQAELTVTTVISGSEKSITTMV
jgi:hypothetical protein